MGKNFFIESGNGLYLYGAATIGFLTKQVMDNKGISVNGFIDKRADEIKTFCELPVYSVDDVRINRESVVVVAVKNVFEHSRIASALAARGFSKIIYRPYNALNGCGTSRERRLYDAYSEITEDNGIRKIAEIPLYEKEERLLTDEAFISEEGDTVKAYIPISFIHIEVEKGTLPILMLRPHMEFIRWVLGMPGGSTEAFMEYCTLAGNRIANIEATEKWKKNVIDNQSEIFLRMNYMYNLHSEFFLQQAPMVKYQKKTGIFVLQSGKHRATFFVSKGRDFIPVSMRKSDYEEYKSMENDKDNYDRNVKCNIANHDISMDSPYRYKRYAQEGYAYFKKLREAADMISARFYNEIMEYGLSEFYFETDIKDDGFVLDFFRRCGCTDRKDCRYRIGLQLENGIIVMKKAHPCRNLPQSK